MMLPHARSRGSRPSLAYSATSRDDVHPEADMTRSAPRSLFHAIALGCLLLFGTSARTPAPKERHLLYVASPGTRNYVEYGGVGLLVFDIDDGYRFVRRIPTWPTADSQKVE